MIRSVIEDRIKNRLGYNTGLQSSYITDAIDDAQDLLEQEPELPWFLETEISSISTTVGEERVPIPSDYIRNIPDNPLWYYNTTGVGNGWIEIPKASMGDLRAWEVGLATDAQSGAPQGYALQGSYFRIFPVPDAAYTLKLVYLAQATKMTADGDENVWAKYAPHVLIGKAGIMLAMNNRDKGALSIFNGIYTDAMKRLAIASEAREHAGAVYARGGAD